MTRKNKARKAKQRKGVRGEDDIGLVGNTEDGRDRAEGEEQADAADAIKTKKSG